MAEALHWQVGDEVQFNGRRFRRFADGYWHDFEDDAGWHTDGVINAEFEAGRALICIRDGVSESDFRLWEAQPGQSNQ